MQNVRDRVRLKLDPSVWYRGHKHCFGIAVLHGKAGIVSNDTAGEYAEPKSDHAIAERLRKPRALQC